MSVLRWLSERRSIENPQIPITEAQLLSILNPTGRSGARAVTVDTALTITAVWRAVTLLSGTVAGMPLKVYERVDIDDPRLARAGDKLQVKWDDAARDELVAEQGINPWEDIVVERNLGNALQVRNQDGFAVVRYGLVEKIERIHAEMETVEVGSRLLSSPNSVQTSFEFWEQCVAHIAMWGNFYALKLRDGANRIVELVPFMPWRIKPCLVVEDGVRVKAFDVHKDKDNRVARLTADDVFHVPGFGYDGIKGLAPLQMAAEALSTALSAEEYAARLWQSGALAGGVLTTPRRLTPDQADAIKRRWQEKIGGVERAHEVAVLDQGVDWKQLSIPPEGAQFIETRRFQVVEVARLFGVPPHMLEDVERSTSWGTGIEEQTISFIMFTVKPNYLQRIERRITDELLPNGRFAEFKVDGLLRGSSKDRAEFYTKALDPVKGWMNRDEARWLENLPKEANPPKPPKQEAKPVADDEENTE